MRLYSKVALLAVALCACATTVQAKPSNDPVMTDAGGRRIPLVPVKGSAKHFKVGKAKVVRGTWRTSNYSAKKSDPGAPVVEMVPGGRLNLVKKTQRNAT